MGALAGAFTEMVQKHGSCSSRAALHCFWSPRWEIGNSTWVPSVLEGFGPAAKEIWFPHIHCHPMQVLGTMARSGVIAILSCGTLKLNAYLNAAVLKLTEPS